MKPTLLPEPVRCPECGHGRVRVHYILSRRDLRRTLIPGWLRCSRIRSCGWWSPLLKPGKGE